MINFYSAHTSDMKSPQELWDKYETLTPEEELDDEGVETGNLLSKESRHTDYIYYDDFFKALSFHDNEIIERLNLIDLSLTYLEDISHGEVGEALTQIRATLDNIITELKSKLKEI